MPRRNTLPSNITPLNELWNLSDLTASWLQDIGYKNYGDLRGADLVHVWLQLRDKHQQVTKLMYYALWGAVHNCHWNKIPEEEKQRLNFL